MVLDGATHTPTLPQYRLFEFLRDIEAAPSAEILTGAGEVTPPDAPMGKVEETDPDVRESGAYVDRDACAC